MIALSILELPGIPVIVGDFSPFPSLSDTLQVDLPAVGTKFQDKALVASHRQCNLGSKMLLVYPWFGLKCC